MTRLSLIAILLATYATAAEPPKYALSDKQIHEGGFIQLFDGETTFGWKVEGDVTVKDGRLILAPKSKITYHVPLPEGSVRIKFDGGEFDADIGTPRNPDRVIIRAEDLTEDFKGYKGGGLTHISYWTEKKKPLFNGKDFTGWRVHDEPKKNASKFDVTKDGELRVVNGPGDLQTTGKYADFLLQFQCKTNGDGLNSGIFFRCIEGQYQNGYECQIQNAMVDNDPTKPKDFGTGAIYRRTPARKIVAKDKEWFSVTLVAHGAQFASWVNGYPVMQWKDERPADDNPRKGLRKAAGHLSIQGHDPTTDILFRKLQIAEFTAAK